MNPITKTALAIAILFTHQTNSQRLVSPTATIDNFPSTHIESPSLHATSIPTGCTSTSTITYTRLSTSPYWDPCSFDGTEHIYTATQTLYEKVDCGECIDVVTTAVPRFHCQAQLFTATVEETTATTTTQTLCSRLP